MSKLITKIHEECPNEDHCEKDEEKCMYLVKGNCLIKKIKKEGKNESLLL